MTPTDSKTAEQDQVIADKIMCKCAVAREAMGDVLGGGKLSEPELDLIAAAGWLLWTAVISDEQRDKMRPRNNELNAAVKRLEALTRAVYSNFLKSRKATRPTIN